MYIRSFDKTKIYYLKCYIKNPKGTILFVHGGFHGNHTMSKRLYKYFQKDYNFIAPDLRGRGNSEFPKNIEEDKLENYAKDLYEILKKEKIKEIFLVGISFGGLVLLKFALMFKKIKIKKLVLISSTYNLNEINKKTKLIGYFYTSLADLICFLTTPLKEHRKKNIDYSEIYGRFFSLKYGLKIILNNSLKTIVLRYKMMKSIRGSSIPKEKLREINSKILLIYGDKDFFFKAKSQEEIKENTRDCVIKKIENAGHNLYVKNPKRAGLIIKKFFAEN